MYRIRVPTKNVPAKILRVNALVVVSVLRSVKALDMWQDTVLTLCNLVFIFALLPSIWGLDKPNLVTSGMMFFTLAVIGMTQISMDLTLSGGSAIISAGLWAVLGYQKLNKVYSDG